MFLNKEQTKWKAFNVYTLKNGYFLFLGFFYCNVKGWIML